MTTTISPLAPSRQTESSPPPTANEPGAGRIHYLDNLRALAMLLGVYLHSAFAYAKPSQSIWLATDPRGSTLVDASIWLIHLFRMSLFFLLAGFFAQQVIEKKGVATFLRNRAIRIGVPFVVFYPFLLGATMAVIAFAMHYPDSPRGLMGLIVDAAKSETPPPGESAWKTMHLWFLYYLGMFTLISAISSRLPITNVNDGVAGWCRPIHLLFAPLLLLPAVLAAGIPLPAPESFVPTWWPFAFYGLFYFVGGLLSGREQVLEKLSPLAWPLTIVSAILFLVYYGTMPVLDLDVIVAGGAAIGPWNYPTATFLTAFLSVALTLSALLLGRAFLNHRSPLLAFFADASYWIYLVHLPVAIFLQTLQLPLPWPVPVKLALTLVGTLLFCTSTYLVFVRYTMVGWVLHGQRTFP